MTARRPDPREEDGTILVLVLGFAAVLLMLVAVVVDVSAAVLAKRARAGAADGAAVAAAQELDLGELYAGGLSSGAIPLSRDQVRDAVERYELQVAAAQPGVDLVGDVSADGRTAVVRAVRRVDLPLRLLGPRSVELRAEARARAPTVP